MQTVPCTTCYTLETVAWRQFGGSNAQTRRGFATVCGDCLQFLRWYAGDVFCVCVGEDLVSESSLQAEEVETGERRVQLISSSCRCTGFGT